MKPRACLARTGEHPQRYESAPRRELRIATRGLAQTEEDSELFGLAREDPAPIAKRQRRGFVAELLGFASRQLDDEGGDLATLSHSCGAFDRHVLHPRLTPRGTRAEPGGRKSWGGRTVQRGVHSPVG